jgi:HlyD family secretion protein
MKTREEWHGRDDESRWAEERSATTGQSPAPRHGETVGPQGAALILELQRIQRVFDQEYQPRGPHAGRRSYDSERAPKPNMHHRPPRPGTRNKKRKGMMGRAVNACLERFGFGNIPSADRRPMVTRDARPPASNRLPRLEQARDHGVPPEHRPPARPRAAMTPKDPPSIGLWEMPAQHAERELAHAAPRIEDGSEKIQRPAAVTARKILVGRALEACLGRAKVGYRYLINPGDEALADDAAGAALATRVGRSFERELRAGLRVLVLGLGVAGGWATLMPLSGAVVVTGSLVVQSNIKKVQHPTGGVVAQIAVNDGMHVNVGDLVVRLDQTQARANLQVVTNQLDEIRVRIARLVAERDGLDEPKMPPELAERSGSEDVNARFASEKSLFKARATARQSQKELLESRIAQLGEQIGGLDAQTKSNASQVDLITGELQGVQSLFDKRLAPITRLNALQRESARLDGERGQLQSTIAETKSKIGEAQLQIIRIDQDFRADVIKDLREAEAKEADLTERRVAAQDQLNRIDIRAPTSGIVHQLTIHTVGGVIGAGEVVMEIVPDSDDLQVEARLSPNDIDQVKVGQTTLVRFSAFNQRTTPQLRGVISYVSADLSHDQQSGTSYYTVRVTLSESEHRRLAGLQLVSGMPAEIFVQTGSRTMMSYLLKPITDQFGRAFTER